MLQAVFAGTWKITRLCNGHRAEPAAQSNGHQPEPESAKMIVESQMNTLLNLYGKLGIGIPQDMDKWSYEQASVGIKELAAQLRAAKAS